MPKAFTHLCQNINLSLYNNTLTIYAKLPELKALPLEPDELGYQLITSQMYSLILRIKNLLMTHTEFYHLVTRDDSDHHLYHQDDFKMNNMHLHAKFKKSIDDTLLENILNIFERSAIISPEEHTSFMKTYHEALSLLCDPSETNEEPSKKNQANSPTLKREFLLFPSLTNPANNQEEKEKAFDLPIQSMPAYA